MTSLNPSSSVGRQLSAEAADTSVAEWRGLVRSWVVYLHAEDKSPNTIGIYEHAVTKKFLPWLIEMGLTGPLSSLTVEHFRHWLSDMKLAGLSGASRLLFRQAVRSYFRFLKDEGEIPTDPFDGRGIPNPKPEAHVTETLSSEEVQRMLKVASRDRQMGKRDVAIMSVLYDAGLRASELCGLRVEDIELEFGSLLVHKAKGGRPRMVSLGKQALRSIDAYLRWRRDYIRSLRWVDESDTDGALFIGRTGTPTTPSTLTSVLKKVAKNAGLEHRSVHPHMFRHSAATSLADSGMGEGDMRELFGWSKGSPMVFRYTQTTAAERARRAHKKMSPLDRVAHG